MHSGAEGRFHDQIIAVRSYHKRAEVVELYLGVGVNFHDRSVLLKLKQWKPESRMNELLYKIKINLREVNSSGKKLIRVYSQCVEHIICFTSRLTNIHTHIHTPRHKILFL